MNFTNSPYEKMMKERPAPAARLRRASRRKAPPAGIAVIGTALFVWAFATGI